MNMHSTKGTIINSQNITIGCSSIEDRAATSCAVAPVKLSNWPNSTETARMIKIMAEMRTEDLTASTTMPRDSLR
jgi:hypothetical protein